MQRFDRVSHPLHFLLTFLSMRMHPGDSKSWESPEKEDNVYRLFKISPRT